MYVLIITYNDNNVIITILIPTLLLLLLIIISTNYNAVCTYITVCTVLAHLMAWMLCHELLSIYGFLHILYSAYAPLEVH